MSVQSGSLSALKWARAKRVADKVSIRDFHVTGWTWGLVAVALASVLATNLFDLSHHFTIRILDANWEFSWSHDVDTLALAVGVLVTAVSARRHVQQRALWSATSVMLAIFFLDEVSPLHAQIGHVSKLLYAPILVALAICVWLLADRTAERSTVFLSLAMLCISFGMHVVGLTLLRPIGYMSWPYQSGVGIKEGTELAGLGLVLLALYRLASKPPIRMEPAVR